MSAPSRSRKIAAVATVAAAVASLGVTPVRAAVHSFGKNYKMTATLKGAQNLTVLLVSAKGQTLASAKVTKSTQKVTLTTSKVSTTKGATIQLVSGASATGKGAYFGPGVVGWSGTKSASASKVTSKLKASSSTSISLGTMQVKKVSAMQGYMVALAKSKLADTSTDALAKASKGTPSGVGNYGKNQSVSSGDFTVTAAAVGDPCTPGTTDCGPDGKLLAPPTNNPVNNNPTNNANNPAGNAGTPAAGSGTLAESTDDLLGGDKDDDGIPNAFDVNDDGDAVVDSADSSTPAPKVAVENDAQTNCASVDFRIFTNFKATGDNYRGTINAYGTGEFEATATSIASTITSTMSMVFSPITSVCGSNVTRTYLKGNGAPYAPTDYVELRNTCNTGDYQWTIGQGKICGGDAAKQFDFGSAYTFSAATLPKGQDTFTMKVETADGNSYEFMSSPGFVFVTHPMIISYNDGTGDRTVQYGSQSVKITVSKSTVLTLKMYRPQRLAFDGETAAFYDLGGFNVTPDIPNSIVQNPTPGAPGSSSPGPGKCDAQGVTDTELTSDQPINTASKPTMTVRWELGKCFDGKSMAWSAGELTVDIQVVPTGPGGNSAQKLFLITTA